MVFGYVNGERLGQFVVCPPREGCAPEPSAKRKCGNMRELLRELSRAPCTSRSR